MTMIWIGCGRANGVGAGLVAAVALLAACGEPTERADAGSAAEQVASAAAGGDASAPGAAPAEPAPAEPAASEAEAVWRERGAAAIGALKRELVGELTAAMAEGGAENAIEVCRVRAPAIAKAVGSPGIRVGRTSHRLRNPANAAPAWVAPLLEDWVAGRRTTEPAVVALGDGRGGYVEPLFAAPMCLTCHGESLAPELEAKLRALYPEDRAIGFRAGELRGLAWAEIDARAMP